MAADELAAAPPSQLAAVLVRHRTFIAAFGAAGLALGIVVGLLMPATYTSSASVLITPLEGNPYSPVGRGDDLVNLGTEAQLAQTDAVARLASNKLRGGDPATLRTRVRVENPGNTQILTISFSGSRPEQARLGAQAFAEAYLDFRRQRSQEIVDSKLARLKEQSQRVRENLEEATGQLASAVGTQHTLLTQQVSSYTSQLNIIDEQANDLSSTDIDPGQVITAATAPGGSQRVSGALAGGASGLTGGLLLGAGIAWLRERLERRVRAAEALERLGVRVLSVIPPLADPGEGLALVVAPRSEVGDAYRRLRSAVVAALPQSPVTILVTSATPGYTAMLTSSNLALALSYAGSTTIMIDAGIAEVDAAALFGLRSPKGLSETLLDGVDPGTLLVHGATHLRLLPRGGRPEESSQRFSGPRMRDAAEVLRERADAVIINAPSLHDADAQALCNLADAVVLVVTMGVTTRDDVIQARIEAERAGTAVVGAVIETDEMDRIHPAARRAPGNRQWRRPEVHA